MSELPNETWTSAYLDGELTAAECAQFERWLVDNPAAQQLLDELRSISLSMQVLPRETLGTDFAKRVLERAEREVLLPQGGMILPLGNITARPEHKRVELSSLPPSAGFDWQRWSRPLLWSAMAAAAALLITFVMPPQHESATRLTRLDTKSSADSSVEPSATADRPLAADSDSLFVSQPKSDEQPMLKKEAATRSQIARPRDLATSAKSGVQSVELQVSPAPAGAAEGGTPASQPLARNLVVLCQVTPAAADQNYFARVLEKNSVSVDKLVGSRESDTAPGTDLRDVQGKQVIPQGAGVVFNRDAQAAGRNQTIYVVEASERQLANVLTDLQNDRADVLAVNVDPAPQVPSQQALTNFGRGYGESSPSNLPAQMPATEAPAALSPPAEAAAQISENKAQPVDAPAVDPFEEEKSSEIEDAAAAPQLTTQSPAAASSVEHLQPVAVPDSDAAEVAERENLSRWYSQNQIRQQIPIAAQQQLSDELKRLSELPTAEAGQIAESAAKVNENQRGAIQNSAIQNNAVHSNARARQINLPQLRPIDANAQLQPEAYGVSQNARAMPGINRQKAADANLAELSGGGSPSKDGRRGRFAEQRQLNSQAQSAGAKAQQLRPPDDEAMPSADKTEANEPLVTAVFVIQAATEVADEVADEAAPASEVPAANEAVAPTKNEPALPAKEGPP